MSGELSWSAAESCSSLTKKSSAPSGVRPPGAKLASNSPLPQGSQEAAPREASEVVPFGEVAVVDVMLLSSSAGTSGSLVEKKISVPSPEIPS